jgi:hypothetical protein
MAETYAFTDISATITHPAYTSFSIQGEGVGDITISKAQERTAHDIAADGSVMISKIAGNNGTITIQKLFNHLWSAPSDQWAQMDITLRAPRMGLQIVASGVAFQKEADRPYQAQGQRIAWPLMAADIQYIEM